MRKLNIGCGTQQPEGWTNADLVAPGSSFADLRLTLPWPDERFDLAVANHALCALAPPAHEHALTELRRVLRPGGVLRIMVPDFVRAVRAWEADLLVWFPNAVDRPDITRDEALCEYVTWFGTNLSVFTLGYLVGLLDRAGFSGSARVAPHASHFLIALEATEATELDDRLKESMFVEAQR